MTTRALERAERCFLTLRRRRTVRAPSLTALPAAFNLNNTRFVQGTSDPLAIDFRALKTVGGLFSMYNVGDIENIAGFAELTSVGGQFTFDSVWAARS